MPFCRYGINQLITELSYDCEHQYYTNLVVALVYFTTLIYIVNFQTTRHTSIGQSLDMLSQASLKEGTAFNFKFTDQFTMKLYNNIVKHKTSYYSFHLPVQLAMLLVSEQL